MDEIDGKASVTQNRIQTELRASWRREIQVMLDGIVRRRPANTQQNPGPVEDVL